jgi:hypothetical protein
MERKESVIVESKNYENIYEDGFFNLEQFSFNDDDIKRKMTTHNIEIHIRD